MRDFCVNRPDTQAMQLLLEKKPDNSTGAILRLAWEAGLLRDEITNLTWDQVSFDSMQLNLPARTVPLSENMVKYLQRMYRRWEFLIGDPANNYVVWSERYRKQMQPQAVSRIARKALDAAGQTEVRLIDLRHDYVIRQLLEHDWSYVARITNTEIRSLQVHFSQYLPGRTAGGTEAQRPAAIDEFKLWKILQAERDTPAGLALWLTWQMGLSSSQIVSLTWNQVDLDRGVIRLPEGDHTMTETASKLLKHQYERRTDDPHVLLSVESRKPLNISRLSRITRSALIRGGMETCTLRDLWVARGESGWEQAIVERIRRHGPVMRREVMEMFGLSKFPAYQRLRKMVERGLLVRVGCKYYVTGDVVPPDQQYQVICAYLKAEGFACRQDLAAALHIGSKQCGALLKREVESGRLVRIAQRYYLKDG